MATDGILTGEGVLLDARPASFATRLLAGAARPRWCSASCSFGVTVAAGALGAEVGAAGRPGAARRGARASSPSWSPRPSRPSAGAARSASSRPASASCATTAARSGSGRRWSGRSSASASCGSPLGSVALLTSLLNDQGKRVGDILAGTYAVRVRGAARTLPPRHHAAAARGLGARGRHAPPAGRPRPVGAAVPRPGRRRCTRRHGSRSGRRLADEVARYVAPPPPPGTHPEAFLAAVLAERRDREFAAAAAATGQRDAAESALLHRLPHGVPDPVD